MATTPWEMFGGFKEREKPLSDEDTSIGVTEGIANACLIAAAPELLAALTEIVSQIDQGGSGGKVFSRDHCITAARAAIGKAVTP